MLEELMLSWRPFPLSDCACTLEWYSTVCISNHFHYTRSLEHWCRYCTRTTTTIDHIVCERSEHTPCNNVLVLKIQMHHRLTLFCCCDIIWVDNDGLPGLTLLIAANTPLTMNWSKQHNRAWNFSHLVKVLIFKFLWGLYTKQYILTLVWG